MDCSGRALLSFSVAEFIAKLATFARLRSELSIINAVFCGEVVEVLPECLIHAHGVALVRALPICDAKRQQDCPDLTLPHLELFAVTFKQQICSQRDVLHGEKQTLTCLIVSTSEQCPQGGRLTGRQRFPAQLLLLLKDEGKWPEETGFLAYRQPQGLKQISGPRVERLPVGNPRCRQRVIFFEAELQRRLLQGICKRQYARIVWPE